jgi:hypothetical protein
MAARCPIQSRLNVIGEDRPLPTPSVHEQDAYLNFSRQSKFTSSMHRSPNRFRALGVALFAVAPLVGAPLMGAPLVVA